MSVLIAALAGCATQGGVSDQQDKTGALGQEGRQSPAKIYVDMGVAYLREGQTATALKKLKKAIKVDPRYAQAHNVIAIVYERLDETELANEHYTKAVRLQPKDPFIRNARGSFFCKQGHFEAAEKEYQTALNNPLYPTPWVAMTNAGLCAERNDDKEQAERYYRQALTANERYFQALYKMTELSLEQKNYLSARAYLERFNSVSEPTAGSLWLGVQIERKLGARAKAMDYRRSLLKDFPDSPEVQLLNRSEAP
jgi:type IV pilus assembly protein PilF